MAIPIISDIIGAVKDLASEVVVDKDKKKEIEYKLKELESQTEERFHQETLAQIEVNKEQAKSGSIFVAGPRPFIMWVGGVGFAYATVVQPFLSWVAKVVFGYMGTFPDLDNELLWTVLLGTLGLGSMRSFEKWKGVSTNDFRDRPDR